MSQTLNLEIKGVHTYNSELSGIPKGALSRGLNINISRLNIAEPRRGFNHLDQELPSSSDRAKKLIFYSSEVIVHYGSTLALYESGSGYTSLGSISEPSNANAIKTAAMSKNLYLTSSSGLKKLDDTSSTIYAAGMPKGTFIELALATVSGTAIDNNSYLTYRYIIGRKDANNNAIYGGVSGRATVFNSGSADNVTVTVYLPSGLTTSHFVQVYRSANSSAEPGDDLQLAYEYPLTSSDISNGYFSFTDIVTDDLLGAYLYTSPSQEGIANDNAEPPLARDIEEYKGHLFFADVESKERFSFTLVACGGSSGLAVDDTLTISDGTTTEVYTAKSSYDAANKHFVVDTATASLATRIDNTIKSFIKLVNSESSLVYAYLLSTGDADLPGKTLLESRALGSDEFTVVSSAQTPWSPQLQATADDTQTSTNDAFKNGLMFSKKNQPESVPLKNIFFVGNSDDRIKRIRALRDGLFIFKSGDDGVYVLRGEDEASFSVTPLDLTAKILAPETLDVVNNLIYGLFSGGVGEVSDSGVSYIDLPIRDAFLPLYGTPATALESYGFGVSYQVEGKYILAVPSTADDTYAVKQWIFDVFGRTWCEWNLNILSGGVNPANNKLYLGAGDDNVIKIERKAYDYTDYADYGGLFTISSYSGTTLTFANVDSFAVGDVLEQSDAVAYIELIDTDANTVEIDTEQTWTTGTADVTLYKGIDCKIEWNPEFAGNPAGFKQFYECNILFKTIFQKAATVYFYSDSNPSEQSIAIASASGNGVWGEFVWGEEVWGGESVKEPERLGIPREQSRCNQLTVRFESRIAWSDFELNGISLTFNPTSTRTAR